MKDSLFPSLSVYQFFRLKPTRAAVWTSAAFTGRNSSDSSPF